jgi:hypothetical protein
MPCSEKRARLLLQRGRARVHRVLPFVIRLVDRKVVDSRLQPLRLKIDPGTKVTGLALVRDGQDGMSVLNLFDLRHRTCSISRELAVRRKMRRSRRGRKTRYRARRTQNRKSMLGRAPGPSSLHEVRTTLSWARRIRSWAPVAGLCIRAVGYDTNAVSGSSAAGMEYRQSRLAGFEVKEGLLEKWRRRCIYCDRKDRPLQVERIHLQEKYCMNRLPNLGIACALCVERRAGRSVDSFLSARRSQLRRILERASRPLQGAAPSPTIGYLIRQLRATNLSIELSTTAQTKYNRARLGLPRAPAIAAACAGLVSSIVGWRQTVLSIKAAGGGHTRERSSQGWASPDSHSRAKRRF